MDNSSMKQLTAKRDNIARTRASRALRPARISFCPLFE